MLHLPHAFARSCILSCLLSAQPLLYFGFQVVLMACMQRETAVAHSGAAWARLQDAFTLSDAAPEVADSDSSLPHRLKVGWNNGAQFALLPLSLRLCANALQA